MCQTCYTHVYSPSQQEITPPPSPSHAPATMVDLENMTPPAVLLTAMLPTATPLKRGSPAAEPGSTSTSRAPIRQQLTGAGALQGISSGLVEFNGIFRDGIESMANPRGIDATPKRKKAAMARAQDLEEDLEDEQMLSIIDLFQTDVSAADAYMTLKRDGLQKAWIRSKLF